MRRLLPTAAILILMASAIVPALAADDDRTICFSLDTENYKDKSQFDIGLNACTRMIGSRQFKDKALASLYRARASWKQKKGALDSALGDLSKSIRIEPENAETYDYRGDVHQQKGELDAALADYDHATRVDPLYVPAIFSRGVIYEKKGNVDKARADYNAAIALPIKNRIAQWAQDNARARLKALADSKP